MSILFAFPFFVPEIIRLTDSHLVSGPWQQNVLSLVFLAS